MQETYKQYNQKKVKNSRVPAYKVGNIVLIPTCYNELKINMGIHPFVVLAVNEKTNRMKLALITTYKENKKSYYERSLILEQQNGVVHKSVMKLDQLYFFSTYDKYTVVGNIKEIDENIINEIIDNNEEHHKIFYNQYNIPYHLQDAVYREYNKMHREYNLQQEELDDERIL